MAVATAAATTMANKAEAALPRRKMAARTNMRSSIDDAAHARAGPQILRGR